MRKEFKKTICTLLAILMISTLSFGLMGCSNTDGAATTEATATGTVDATGETVENATGEATEPTGDATEPTGDATEATGETTDATTDTTAATEAGSNGHVHNYNKTIMPPKCATSGYDLYECSCGHSYTDGYYAPVGHGYRKTTVEGTNGEPGYIDYYCTYCKDHYTEPLESSSVPQEPTTNRYTPPNAAEVAAAVVKHINNYRAQVGASPATSVNGLTTIAQERAAQLVYDYQHDGNALRALCNKYQYGKYIDATIYGDDASNSYYTFGGAEAICKGDIRGTADQLGSFIAKAFFESSGHWRYVGDGANAFIGAGVTYNSEQDTYYCCVNLSKENYG